MPEDEAGIPPLLVGLPDSLAHWVASRFPEVPHARWVLSGATMLFEALAQTSRRTVILPAFICPELSAMALRAGKHIAHIDVDRDTLLMNQGKLEQCLAEHDDEETVLLVDHPFGYPFPGLTALRERHPGLLIIEDCVRALGGEVRGIPVGRSGDWVLLSLYKTTPGSDHGAVLLTRFPYAQRAGPTPRSTLREHLATFGPARWVYERLKRYRPGPREDQRDRESVPWEPLFGAPTPLALRRFDREVGRLERDVVRRRQAAREIEDALNDLPALRFIRSKLGCQPSGYFLGFTVSGDGLRNRLLTLLHRKGIFLVSAWSVVPAHYRSLSHTFPFGSSESRYLADHVAHVPVFRYLKRHRREWLIRCVRECLKRA